MSSARELDVTVLYVEDDAATREEVAAILRRRVRELWVAGDGEQGLALFGERRPDIVITDIRMPKLDGLGMTKAIRALDADVHIVVMSAHGDAEYLLDAINQGLEQYVLKPIETDKLLAALDKCARQIALRHAAAKHAAEREQLVGELQAAVAKAKLLSGFLPICAACKKIRDDRGYWQQIESYIHNHSEAEFSHGICPECARRLYGLEVGGEGPTRR